MRLLLSILLLLSTMAHGQSTGATKAETESLMNAAIPFAKQMLVKYGEFYPYGHALNVKGEVVAIAGYDGRENPPSAAVIEILNKGFIQGARNGTYKATALVYDARVQLPSSGMKSDAIAVSLNHRSSYSVVVYFPYKIEGSKLVEGEAFATEGRNDVFGK